MECNVVLNYQGVNVMQEIVDWFNVVNYFNGINVVCLFVDLYKVFDQIVLC